MSTGSTVAIDTPPRRHGVGAYFNCFSGIVWREVLRFLYQRERFLSALVRPLVWLFIFAAGFRQVLGVSIIPPYTTYVLYETFITPGLIGMILLFNAMQSSLSMVYDRETGAMRTLLVAPFPRSFLLSSKLVGGVAVAVLQAYTFLVIAYFWDIIPPAIGYLTVLPALVLSGMMLGALALLMSSVIRQLENFAGVMNFVIFPMFFASSALYPLWRIKEGSPLLYEIAKLNPFTHAVELIRFALYGQVGRTLEVGEELWAGGPTAAAGVNEAGIMLPLQSGQLLDITHLVVVIGCTLLFLAAAIYAYNPSKGLIAKRGGPGGG
ncbi:MAG: ABC transporter permease [Hyphomicrobium sp.]|nr:ABC transporter permease [Hyphomicrobium sp.]